jgi:hypothetical protein
VGNGADAARGSFFLLCGIGGSVQDGGLFHQLDPVADMDT